MADAENNGGGYNPRIAACIRGSILKTARCEYRLGRKLGKGAIGVVQAGVRTDDNKKCALKILKRPMRSAHNLKIMFEYMDAEVEAMKKVDHKNVLALLDYSTDVDYNNLKGDCLYKAMVIVLELAPGGELFDILLYYGKLDEHLARKYFHQLMSGLKAIHDAGFVHRDLKPQNLLLDRNFQLKIADFGHAKELKSENMLMNTHRVGTKGYHAPEQLISPAAGNSRRRQQRIVMYNRKVDIFSCGVILFILVTGHPPFQQALPTDRWFKELAKGQPRKFWKKHTSKDSPKLSPELQDAIVKLLCYQPTDRILPEAALSHPWLTDAPMIKDKELRLLMITRHKSTMATKRQKAAEDANVTISTIEATSPFYGDDSDLTSSDEEDDPVSFIEVPSPARSRNNTPMTHQSSHDPDDIDDVVALNTERNKRRSVALGIRRRGKGSEPTISKIMQNYDSGIQAPEEGRPSMVDFTPFVGEVSRDDDLDEGDFDYNKNPEVSDMHLNPWNSHVIKKDFHPYQLLLPVYRFFQNEGGEIEFDAERFTLKIRKHPLRWKSIRPEPGNPMNADVSDPKPVSSKPPLEDKLKSHDIDDDFMSSASIELKPDMPDSPDGVVRLNTVRSDVQEEEEDFNDYDQEMEHEEMVNIYCTCVRRKSDGDNLFTVYSKHGDLSFAARKQLRLMLDQLFHRIAPFTDMPYYDDEEEESREIH